VTICVRRKLSFYQCRHYNGCIVSIDYRTARHIVSYTWSFLTLCGWISPPLHHFHHKSQQISAGVEGRVASSCFATGIWYYTDIVYNSRDCENIPDTTSTENMSLAGALPVVPYHDFRSQVSARDTHEGRGAAVADVYSDFRVTISRACVRPLPLRPRDIVIACRLITGQETRFRKHGQPPAQTALVPSPPRLARDDHRT